MFSIEEHRNSLTLFYSLSSGKIKCYCGGIQTMDYFGDDRDDYNYDFIVIKHDDFVMRNINLFKVVEGKLVFEQPSLKY